jgi:(R,R)-butanediol dehydrogenase/meso-butanediol dehydrogenase/diacetyl reductase
MVEPTAVAMNAVSSAPVRPGDVVLVTGAGPIGQLTALAVHAAGAAAIVSEPNAGRRERASDIGLLVHNPLEESVFQPIQNLGEERADACIECAGSNKALQTCIEATRPGGVIVQTGLHGSSVEIDINSVTVRNITIRGCIAYPVRSWPRVIRVIASGQIPAELVITDVIALDDIVEQGFNALLDPVGSAVKILVRP